MVDKVKRTWMVTHSQAYVDLVYIVSERVSGKFELYRNEYMTDSPDPKLCNILCLLVSQTSISRDEFQHDLH